MHDPTACKQVAVNFTPTTEKGRGAARRKSNWTPHQPPPPTALPHAPPPHVVGDDRHHPWHVHNCRLRGHTRVGSSAKVLAKVVQ